MTATNYLPVRQAIIETHAFLEDPDTTLWRIRYDDGSWNGGFPTERSAVEFTQEFGITRVTEFVGVVAPIMLTFDEIDEVNRVQWDLWMDLNNKLDKMTNLSDGQVNMICADLARLLTQRVDDNGGGAK